ncbi:SNF2 family N-terminal domain-containing protein [Abortiporus biennis]|nr:SNF2 family N-terminal domain-containing protein [Abortiporus biennis]
MSDDELDQFEPPTSPVPTPSSPVARPKQIIRRRVFVEVPTLPIAQKEEYKPLQDVEFVASDDEYGFNDSDIESVVGEYLIDGQLYYYARVKPDMIAYKFLARTFVTRHKEKVAAYERQKANGSMQSFDPSSHNVHPNSRVKITLRLANGSKKAKSSRKTSRELEDWSLTTEASEDNSGSEFGSDRVSDRPLRRGTRAGTSKLTKLPFSPRKTRSNKPILVHDSDDDSEEDIRSVSPSPNGARRSSRNKKPVRRNLDVSLYEGFESSISEGTTPARTGKPVKKKKIRTVSRATYGHFRPVEDLAYDSDEETRFLRAHRRICDKCQRPPAHELLKKRKGKKKDDETVDEDVALGGWVRCLYCPVTAHWGCLARTQRDEILRAALEKDRAEWKASHQSESGSADEPGKSGDAVPRRREGLDVDLTTEFICNSCMKGGFCMGCKEVALKPDDVAKQLAPPTAGDSTVDQDGDAAVADRTAALSLDDQEITKPEPERSPSQLLFRCITCKRLAHYAHLPQSHFDAELTLKELARYHQHTLRWQCSDCNSFVYDVEHILAWRPFPEHVVESFPPEDVIQHIKSPLPREYLIKWIGRSYRRTTWVPHMWLLAKSQAKLKNFLVGGSHVKLLQAPEASAARVEEPSDAFDPVGDVREESTVPDDASSMAPSGSMPDAEKQLNPGWITVDRILDVLFWYPDKRIKPKPKGRAKQKTESEVEAQREEANIERENAFEFGEQLPDDLTETAEQREKRTGKEISQQDVKDLVWAFIKWEDLGYDQATWDTPPKPEDPGYPALLTAFKRYREARVVVVPKPGKIRDEIKKRPLRFTDDRQPQLGQNQQLRLMNFQIIGVNWLCNNLNERQHCILADEMGLGKTVQIVAFLGSVIEKRNAFPALVVVPNSTITNWVREFERWAPRIRVCPFYGDHKAREIIKQYELSHEKPASGTTGAKYHVLVTTYETVTNQKEFGSVFKQVPRWEVLVVDEGQRLKSDSSLIFKRLKELTTIHRIILTGTPLNNNIRELFNLMNFLDPSKWNDLDKLAREHEELTEDKVRELHVRLKPYFLRRIKSEVLQLPPKNEVIVPVSMAPLQKEVYRSILSQNVNILKSIASGVGGGKVNAAAAKRANMNNILMQLRKCLQHPYLVSSEIEPKGLSPSDAHEKLIDASAKLRLLKILLPKLKARLHRVLLFSQFAIALDIVEDFLYGEGIKYLRLDGNTKQEDRQKGMDQFNKEGSDIFIYLLTTRAGGVGINLWSADTVIIFDPDFNPHQDLQAIARAHRYGQQKTCLVFKLMVKESAEERIMQTGKKKLILDHLIVQKMDDDEGREDVQSILMFGAQTLFEDSDSQAAKDIHYSETDIDKLIEKTEKEGDQPEQQSNESNLFSFAKVWAADKDDLEDIADDSAEATEQKDSWAQMLELIAAEGVIEQEKEATGRGVRRRAAAVFTKPQDFDNIDNTPKKDKDKSKKKKGKNKKPAGSDESDAYVPAFDAQSDISIASSHNAESERSEALAELLPSKTNNKKRRLSPGRPSKSVVDDDYCGLCGKQHGESACEMTNDVQNLIEYREILMNHSDDEPLADRLAAIAAIEEELFRRRMGHLLVGQPLFAIEAHPRQVQPLPANVSNGARTSRQPSSLQQPQVNQPNTTNTAVRPPKRPLSPERVEGESAKKAKDVEERPSCPVCGQRGHIIKYCPSVLAGSQSIIKAISRLKGDPSHNETVQKLKKIYKKHIRLESALARSVAAERAGSPDVMVVSD